MAYQFLLIISIFTNYVFPNQFVNDILVKIVIIRVFCFTHLTLISFKQNEDAIYYTTFFFF
jgi:hypothetical protein